MGSAKEPGTPEASSRSSGDPLRAKARRKGEFKFPSLGATGNPAQQRGTPGLNTPPTRPPLTPRVSEGLQALMETPEKGSANSKFFPGCKHPESKEMFKLQETAG